MSGHLGSDDIPALVFLVGFRLAGFCRSIGEEHWAENSLAILNLPLTTSTHRFCSQVAPSSPNALARSKGEPWV
jgi:hypothetical protein